MKLSKHEDDIISLINEGVPKARIAKKIQRGARHALKVSLRNFFGISREETGAGIC